MRLSNRSLAALAAMLPLAAAPAMAQDAPASKLSIHGYLTQGAAVSDSNSVVGISDQGTTNYRRAAILMRYAETPRDAFVLQVAHRRLGDSPTMQFEPDVKVDWAFYERRFGDHTSMRVGKAPIPYGVFNETRYTGTLLPFYRAPYAFYFEGAYTSETIDGAVLSHSFLAESPFRVDASIYGGNYDLIEYTQARVSPTQYAFLVGRARSRSSLGGQLWMNTPVEGLRVGGGGSRATMEGGLLRAPGHKETTRNWHAGVDANFDRFAVRSEYREADYEALDYKGYYVQAGARVIGSLSVNAQHELGNITGIRASTGLPFDIDMIHDNALGLNYAFRPDLVLKVEGHKTKGFNVEEGMDLYSGMAPKGFYAITSLSLSF